MAREQEQEQEPEQEQERAQAQVQAQVQARAPVRVMEPPPVQEPVRERRSVCRRLRWLMPTRGQWSLQDPRRFRRRRRRASSHPAAPQAGSSHGANRPLLSLQSIFTTGAARDRSRPRWDPRGLRAAAPVHGRYTGEELRDVPEQTCAGVRSVGQRAQEESRLPIGRASPEVTGTKVPGRAPRAVTPHGHLNPRRMLSPDLGPRNESFELGDKPSCGTESRSRCARVRGHVRVDRVESAQAHAFIRGA